jgi:chorismate mutase
MASTPDQQLDALRREVDRLDGAMVELLAERMRVVQEIAAVKRPATAGRPAIRPGREAVILRRLVERAAGRFPAAALVRMWRELLAATTRAQAPLSVVVRVPPDQPHLWDLARDHFGSLTPIRAAASGAEALRLVAEDPLKLAVLPLPDARDDAWWTELLDDGRQRQPLRIVARLPFVATSAGGGGALVVSAIEPEPSGEDVSVLAVEARAGLGRAELIELLAAAGPAPRWLAAAPLDRGGPVHLVELMGWLAPREERSADALTAATREHVLRVAWLGGYARPLAGDA